MTSTYLTATTEKTIFLFDFSNKTRFFFSSQRKSCFDEGTK